MVENSDSLSILKGSGVVFLGTVLELGISFIAKVVVARVLGSTDYGVVSIGITVLAISSTLVLLGFHTGVARYLPRYGSHEEKRGVMLSALQIFVPLSAVVGGTVVLFADVIATIVFSDASVGPILRVLGFAIPIAAFVKFSIGGMQGAKEPFPRVVISNLTLPAVRFGAVILLLVLGFGASGVAWAYWLSYASAGIVSVYFLWKHTSLFADVSPVYRRRELLSFSLPLVVSGAMALLFTDLDILLLGYFVSADQVGTYSAIYPIASLLTVGLTSFGFLFLPVLSELHEKNEFDRMRRMYQVVTKWVFVPTFPAFLVLFAFPDAVIRLFFGDEYVAGALGLSILSVGFFVHTVTGLNTSSLTSIGRTRTVMVNNAVAGGANLVLNLVLIPRYSFVGAALATTASYLLLNGLHSYRLYRTARIHPFSRALVYPGTAATIFASVLLFLSIITDPEPLLLSAMVVGFVLVYTVIVIELGGIEREELVVLEHIEERLGVDLSPVKRVAKQYQR